MIIEHFYDERTFTLTYLVYDKETGDAVIIDPVLDYDPASGKIYEESFCLVKKRLKELGIKPKMVLETHAHADHISSAQLFKKQFGDIKIGIGANIKKVQKVFKNFFNLGKDFAPDGSQFDLLFEDNQEVSVGSLKFKVLFTPGHTPACVSYLFGDVVFTGDALFMPDMGTGRCDFPEGSAADLYHSIHEVLYKLPDETKVYVGHDYQPGGRDLEFVTTIGKQKEVNIQLSDEVSKDDFIEAREKRDAILNAPKLLFPSVQVNINAGHLPEEEENGKAFLKIPIGA